MPGPAQSWTVIVGNHVEFDTSRAPRATHVLAGGGIPPVTAQDKCTTSSAPGPGCAQRCAYIGVAVDVVGDAQASETRELPEAARHCSIPSGATAVCEYPTEVRAA